jgi:hypothetical protein
MTTATFSIDSSVTQSYNAPVATQVEYHQKFWVSPTLQNGSHTLIIAVSDETHPPRLFFDYFLCSLSAGSLQNQTLFIDDSDPQVQYQGDWLVNNSQSVFGGTIHINGGSPASAALYFKGHSISVFGVAGGNNNSLTLATFTVDDSAPFNYQPPSQSSQSFNSLIYSTVLDDDDHILSINTTSDQPLPIDYFLVNAINYSTNAGVEAKTVSSNTLNPHSDGPKELLVILLILVSVFLVCALIGLFYFKQRSQTRDSETCAKPFILTREHTIAKPFPYTGYPRIPLRVPYPSPFSAPTYPLPPIPQCPTSFPSNHSLSVPPPHSRGLQRIPTHAPHVPAPTLGIHTRIQKPILVVRRSPNEEQPPVYSRV